MGVLLVFPTSIDDIINWCHRNKFKIHEGRQRYAEYVILSCIALDHVLSKAVVLKGGNALRFFYNSPRSTLDLDFSIDAIGFTDEVIFMREKLQTALIRAEQRFRIKAKCQRVKRQPLGAGATRPTYDIAIGYQYSGDRYYNNFDEKNVSTTIPMEISLNDKVCESIPISLASDIRGHLRVCNLEDITAEKLRALLQQPLRNRNRGQDVYDIARIFTMNKSTLDYVKIARYLHEKAEIRDIHANASAFNDIVQSMAEYEYDKRILEQTGKDFIPFNDAWALVIDLVKKLNLPE